MPFTQLQCLSIDYQTSHFAPWLTEGRTLLDESATVSFFDTVRELKLRQISKP